MGFGKTIINISPQGMQGYLPLMHGDASGNLSAIQPAVAEAGIEGLWTPVVAPRLGYCDYSCNACGQVCPVQAIPPLSLEEKRQQVIGQAYIDQNRCIPWAAIPSWQDCIVCEEMCPVPDKAIKLEEVEVQTTDGELAIVHPTERLKRTLDITKMSTVIKVHSDEQEAIKALVRNT